MRDVIKLVAKKSGFKQTKIGKRIVKFRKVWNFADVYLDTIKTLKRKPPFDFALMDIDNVSPSMSPNV